MTVSSAPAPPKDGYTALVKTEQSGGFENVSDAGCEDIMIHLEKEETI